MVGGMTGCSYKQKPVFFKTPNKIEQDGKPLVRWGGSNDSLGNKESLKMQHGSDSLAALSFKLRDAAVGAEPRVADSLIRKADECVLISKRWKMMADSIQVAADSLARLPYMHRIKPDDIIALRFLNNFDLTEGVAMTAGQSEISFLVDIDGYVYLPMLGLVKLGGMTRQEASRHLEKLYSNSFKNPSIEVYINNLSVTIMGAVKSEGNFKIVKEQTTIVEALALAGGVSEFGRKKQIKIIRSRGIGEEPEVIVYDLTQIAAMSEEEIIVHDKDIIYVEPTGIKVFTERANPFLTLFSFVTSTSAITITLLTVFRSN